MKVTYNDNSKHTGDNIESMKIVNSGMSKDDKDVLMTCVKESGVTRDDIERLIEVLKDINLSQNDLTTEFAKMVVEQESAQKKGKMKKLQDGVALTNGMVTLGKTVIGIVSKNPGIAIPVALELAKEMTK